MNKFLVLLFAILFSNAFASEPQIWTVNTRAEILKGDARSVSVDANGSITPAPKLTELFKTDQQYIWSSATDNAGFSTSWYSCSACLSDTGNCF